MSNGQSETARYPDEVNRRFGDYRAKLKELATIFSGRKEVGYNPLEELVVVSGERVEDGDEKYNPDFSYRFRFLDVMPVLSQEGSSTDKDAFTALGISKSGRIVELELVSKKGGGLLATGTLIATLGVLPGLVMSRFLIGRDSVTMKNLTNLRREDLELLNELGAESLDCNFSGSETLYLGSKHGDTFPYTTVGVVMERKPGQKGRQPNLSDDKRYVRWKEIGRDAFVGVLPTRSVVAPDFRLVQDGAPYNPKEMYDTLIKTTDLAIKSVTQVHS